MTRPGGDRLEKGPRRSGWLLATVVAVGAAFASCGDPAVPPVPLDPSGNPADPQVTCLGLAPAKCQEFVRQTQRESPANPPVAIRIVCTAIPCTEQAGQVSIDVIAADGSRSTSGAGWASAVGGGVVPPPVPVPATAAPESGPPQAPPTLPPGIQPTCVSLPAADCDRLARSVLTDLPPGTTVASITVTCDGACDAAKGRGTTVVVFADGSVKAQPWAYEGSE